MEFIAVALVFLTVLAGLVLVLMSVGGGDPGQPLVSRFFGIGPPVLQHPPATHRVRTLLTGLAVIAVGVLLAVVLIA